MTEQTPDRESQYPADAYRQVCEQVRALRAENERLGAAFDEARFYRSRAEAALDRVRALHQDRGGGDGYCITCYTPDGFPADWPCETAVALDGDR